MNHKKGNFCFTLTLFLLISAVGLYAAEIKKEEDIVVGKAYTFHSDILEQDVTISVFLPRSYEASGKKFPVLYDMNGFMDFKMSAGIVEFLGNEMYIPEMIVIGLPGIRGGYVPTRFDERTDKPAGADKTLVFFKKELMPWVNAKLRTNGYNVLTGHSVAGLFTVYALFNYTELFDTYLASSPWFQTMYQYWLKNIEKLAKQNDLTGKTLYMTVGEGESQLTRSTYKELEKWMNKQQFSDLRWKSVWLPDVEHGNMVGLTLYGGLNFVFDGLRLSFDLVTNADIEAIKKHYTEVNERIHYPESFKPGEGFLNRVGYYLIRQKEFDKAINLLKYNSDIYPESFNACDSLGDAYQNAGKTDKAAASFQAAIDKNPGNSDYEKRVLKSSKEKLEKLKTDKKK